MAAGNFTPQSLSLIDKSICYWQKQGYVFVDLPWVIEERYTRATCPPGGKEVVTPYGNLVASGEQSFLKLYTEKSLPLAPGYVGWTPCFRDEPFFDQLHQFYFLKAEVFVPLTDKAAGPQALDELVARQTELFRALCVEVSPPNAAIERQRINREQLDLCLGGIEIGSYGFRCFKELWYLYGTALALPRFTIALGLAHA